LDLWHFSCVEHNENSTRFFMSTITGIFNTMEEARIVYSELKTQAGFRDDELVLLTPGTTQKELNTVPADEGEQPGMGGAIGGVVGGAVGLAAGSIISNLILPGVGPIVAFGLGAAALGLGGAAIGAAGGGAIENQLSGGLPKDEIFFYEDALRQCRSIVIATSTSDDAIEKGRSMMQRDGAETIDAARDKWWIGLRDSEAEQYEAPGEHVDNYERRYRCGFEAALRPDFRNTTYDKAAPKLRQSYPDVYEDDVFRRGFERGRAYYAERHKPSF
jgi:hypothetical protein